MYTIETTTKFERDIKLMQKRGANLLLLKNVISLLELGQQLPPPYKNHKLIGDMQGLWDCHIQSDWLLIYRRDEKSMTIILVATGTHSDLF